MVSGVTQTPSFGFDKLYLSGLQAQRRQAAADLRNGRANADQPDTEKDQSAQGMQAAPAAPQYSAEQQRQINAMAAIDRKVRAHEQAHLNVGADLVRGGPSYSYQTGPDGKRYAVAGDVQIDTSKGRNPEETIPKAQHIRATALAPADPSSQDRQVAALAAGMEMEARQELALQMRQQGSLAGQAIAAYEAMDEEAPPSGFRAYA